MLGQPQDNLLLCTSSSKSAFEKEALFARPIYNSEIVSFLEAPGEAAQESRTLCSWAQGRRRAAALPSTPGTVLGAAGPGAAPTWKSPADGADVRADGFPSESRHNKRAEAAWRHVHNIDAFGFGSGFNHWGHNNGIFLASLEVLFCELWDSLCTEL